MRLSRFACHVSSFSLITISSSAIYAQELSATARSGRCTAIVLGGATAAANDCAEADPQGRSRTIEPYTANQKTTTIQTLANGTTITRETNSRQARDSSGRSFRENAIDFPMVDGETHKQSMFNVFDPVNRITINWSSQSKEAVVFHMADPTQIRHVQLPPSQPIPVPVPVTGIVAAGSNGGQVRPTHEDLGTRTINGLEAKGTRVTTTYPVGRVGNDQPLTVTHETWMSTDLRIPVLQIDNDPRTGVRTVELTDIERGEPDSSLFQPPEGYTVRDQYPKPAELIRNRPMPRQARLSYPRNTAVAEPLGHAERQQKAAERDAA